MANYFRITAYHPTEDVGMIVDSNGQVRETLAVLRVPRFQRFQDPRRGERNKILGRQYPQGRRKRQTVPARLYER